MEIQIYDRKNVCCLCDEDAKCVLFGVGYCEAHEPTDTEVSQ